jgi:glycosyltransferase involved in cell wall biosynthesis
MKRSILVNNHNNARFLRACLDSVLEQVLPGDEVIVYDDGSTDGSREILQSYADRIQLTLAPKLSVGYRECQMVAITSSFAKSTGQLIFLLDGDDTFLPGKLDAYTAAFKDPEVSMVQAPMLHIDAQGEKVADKRHEWAHGIDTIAEISRTHDLDYFYPTSALGFRREMFETCLPLDLDTLISADIAFSIAAVLLGRVVTLNEPWTTWRQHRANHSSRFDRPFHRLRFDLQIAGLYNQLAKRFGQKRRISSWKNRKLYRRTARHITHDLLKLR